MYWYYLDDGSALNLSHATEIFVEEEGQYYKVWAMIESGGENQKHVLKKCAEWDDANNFIRGLVRKMNGES